MPWHWPISTASTRPSSTRNGYWKRSSVELVCAALICYCGQAWAEFSIRPLDQQPFDTDVAELFPLGQKDLLLRTRGWREPKPTRKDVITEPWSTLYVLAPGGQVKERVELPYGIYQVIAPFGEGFAIQRLVTTGCAPNCSYGSSEPTQIVIYKSAKDPQPKVVFEPGAPFHTPRLYGTTRGQDLYVMEMGAQFRITRIDSSGRIAWQKTTGWLESSSFATTDDGVVFVQDAAENDPSMVLRAIDREGRDRWKTPIPSTRGYEAIYSATDGSGQFITLPTYPADLTKARDKRRLLNFHASTGKLMSDVLVPQFAYATGTRHGLLVAGSMLGQSYAGMLNAFGEYSWLRRYVADRNLSDIRRATTNYRGDLILVTREQRTTIDSPTSVVVTDSTAEGIGEARGGCLDPEWREAVEFASQVSMRGIGVAAPTTEELLISTNDAQGCTSREKQFIAFMQGLSAAMATQPVRARAYNESISVRLAPAGQPLLLESYSVTYGGFTGGGTSLSFVSAYDRPEEFWKIVATQVRPHLDTMAELAQRFATATHDRYWVDDRRKLPAGQVLSELERAARTVDERIAKIAPATLAKVRKGADGYGGIYMFMLRADGFGGGDGRMFPLAAADRTVVDLIEQYQRDAAQGGVVIRD